MKMAFRDGLMKLQMSMDGVNWKVRKAELVQKQNRVTVKRHLGSPWKQSRKTPNDPVQALW